MSSSIFIFQDKYNASYKKDSTLFLKSILSKHFNQNIVKIIRTENGKPFLKNGPFFSISHSHEKIILALSFKHPVGVDIEYINPHLPFKKIAKKFFSPQDLTTMDDSPESFYHIWTQKEAFVKLLGKGILMPEFQNHQHPNIEYQTLNMHNYAGHVCFDPSSSQASMSQFDEDHGYKGNEYA